MRRFYLIALLFVALTVGAQTQQDKEATAAETERLGQRLQRQVQEQLLEMERNFTEQSEVNLRRLEGVEKNAEAARENADRILLIFAFFIVLGFFFISGNLRLRQQQMMAQLHGATRGAEDLMRDIRREYCGG